MNYEVKRDNLKYCTILWCFNSFFWGYIKPAVMHWNSFLYTYVVMFHLVWENRMKERNGKLLTEIKVLKKGIRWKSEHDWGRWKSEHDWGSENFLWWSLQGRWIGRSVQHIYSQIGGFDPYYRLLGTEWRNEREL